ncbi:MAG: hypothetical protein H0X31_02290 [Nostocaceae cyanobacterium]|nr:hypothetical protein [Nostocaceae cyanobacterium]
MSTPTEQIRHPAEYETVIEVHLKFPIRIQPQMMGMLSEHPEMLSQICEPLVQVISTLPVVPVPVVPVVPVAVYLSPKAFWSTSVSRVYLDKLLEILLTAYTSIPLTQPVEKTRMGRYLDWINDGLSLSVNFTGSFFLLGKLANYTWE